MVATSGSGWVLAPSLVALIAETDRLYPNRDHGSDGSIGDADHATRESQHNPENGYVCAVDIDEDLSAGLHSLNELARNIVDDRDHRVRYLIYEGRISKSYVDARGVAAWTWQTYTGLNDHSHHLHVSVWNTPAARDDTGPWWPQPEEDDMTPAECEAVVRKVLNEGTGTGQKNWAGTSKGTLSTVQSHTNKLNQLIAMVEALREEIAADS